MPWLRDWGRDTFIALPGLLLSAERYHLAGQVLSLFASHVNDGMVPSKFAINPAEPIYDAVDPSLWFIHAAHEYLRASKDQETFDAILKDACHEIVDGFTRGTRLGIHVDPEDDLLSAGSQDSALTWMDARAEDGTPHTSRDGKAVEINALWYHALCLVGDDRSERVAKHFNDAFVLPGRGLADVVRGGPGRYERDETIRPNQIFAVSLRHSPLERATQHVVTDVVRRSLLTPYGLRTLDRHDERYKPTVIGNPLERSRAAHDGAVWPWLIGPFLDAHLRIHDGSAASRERARTWLRPLIDHLDTGLVETGLIGYLPEVFDGQYPYLPGGCFGQAWSVAEVFRLAIELDL
jgi:predicted glycogen debranching enzyme